VRELSIKCQTYGTTESNCQNIKSSLGRGLPEITPALCAHDGTFIVAGSGPSLPQFLDQIKEEKAKGRPICAVKGAHDLLVEHGITPDLFICVDPRDRRENLKLKNQETIYLMASRCDPVMFDHLKGHKVILWHSFGSMEEAEAYLPKPAIGGGSTSGMRAITVGWVLGFRKFILYGMDSCLAEDRITKRFTGEEAGQVVDVIVDGKTFYCNGAMAQQAKEFQELYSVFPGIQIESKYGLLKAIIEARAKL